MQFTHAITRRPGKSLVLGISTANLGVPDPEKALKQHDAYVEALKKCGLQVLELKAEEAFPDATFVEDVAICTSKFALITRPGAVSRQRETELILAPIHQCFNEVYEIKSPGTLEGGDVMMVGDHFYIGLSERTNRNGAKQFIGWLKEYGMNGSVVEFAEILHLKTGVSYLENNNLLVSNELLELPFLKKFNLIPVPHQEAYAANCIWVNGTVLVPAGFHLTKEKIEGLGYPIIELAMSEFQKVDGGLSCLSLRF